MSEIKIHILHTGKVCVARALPFGGDDCNIIKASGLLDKKEDRLWLPVSAYLIESPHGLILFDCGWHRHMSPKGTEDKQAQIKSLGSKLMYKINQGVVPIGEAIDEQLFNKGIKPKDLDLVLLSHLDCDHANGLELVKEAQRILVSQEELDFANKKTLINKIRYNPKWWNNTSIEGFHWNDTQGAFHKSYDVFGDGSIEMINIPGHSNGQCALKITNSKGQYVLLYADGGYAKKSWEEMITSGIAADKKAQKKSLEWIRNQSMDKNCIGSYANHDPNIKPQIIEL